MLIAPDVVYSKVPLRLHFDIRITMFHFILVQLSIKIPYEKLHTNIYYDVKKFHLSPEKLNIIYFFVFKINCIFTLRKEPTSIFVINIVSLPTRSM